MNGEREEVQKLARTSSKIIHHCQKTQKEIPP
jgi:hypothetical protein